MITVFCFRVYSGRKYGYAISSRDVAMPYPQRMRLCYILKGCGHDISSTDAVMPYPQRMRSCYILKGCGHAISSTDAAMLYPQGMRMQTAGPRVCSLSPVLYGGPPFVKRHEYSLPLSSGVALDRIMQIGVFGLCTTV